jgi:hypothetical protein
MRSFNYAAERKAMKGSAALAAKSHAAQAVAPTAEQIKFEAEAAKANEEDGIPYPFTIDEARPYAFPVIEEVAAELRKHAGYDELSVAAKKSVVENALKGRLSGLAKQITREDPASPTTPLTAGVLRKQITREEATPFDKLLERMKERMKEVSAGSDADKDTQLQEIYELLNKECVKIKLWGEAGYFFRLGGRKDVTGASVAAGPCREYATPNVVGIPGAVP